jgi:hypothetical protein
MDMDTIEHETHTSYAAPADPLSLDPLSPIALRPARFAATTAPADPLALDPLRPIVPQPHDR